MQVDDELELGCPNCRRVRRLCARPFAMIDIVRDAVHFSLAGGAALPANRLRGREASAGSGRYASFTGFQGPLKVGRPTLLTRERACNWNLPSRMKASTQCPGRQTTTYRRVQCEWPETVCAENIQWYAGTEADVPRADKPRPDQTLSRCASIGLVLLHDCLDSVETRIRTARDHGRLTPSHMDMLNLGGERSFHREKPRHQLTATASTLCRMPARW